MQILVLGMHRSGTSAVTRLINMMGAYFGPEGIAVKSSESNPKGFWERRDVVALNDEALQLSSATWNRVLQFDPGLLSRANNGALHERVSRLVLGMDANRPWVLKDPRLCLTLPLWRRALEAPVVVLVHRCPVEIAKSLRSRDGIPINVGVALWEHYWRSAVMHCSDLPTISVSHAELMDKPAAVADDIFDGLSALGVTGLRKPSAAEVQAFVDANLYRSRSDASSVPSYLNGVQAQLLDALRVDGASLADVSTEVSNGAQDTLRQHETSLLDRERIHNLSDELNVARQQIEADRKSLAERESENHSLRTNLHDLRQNLAQSEQTVRELRAVRDTVPPRPVSRMERRVAKLMRDPQKFFADSQFAPFRMIAPFAPARKQPRSGPKSRGTTSDHPKVPVARVKASAPLKFRNFSEYSRQAILHPELVRSPLSEPGRRVLGVMEWNRKALAAEHREKPQDQLVSIIMPARNRADVIDVAIASVLAQTYVNWELIVVDDASTDGTAEAVERYTDPRIHLVRLTSSTGVSRARNQGIAASQGRFLAYLDSDDVWEPDFILISLNELKKYPKLDLVYSAQFVWDAEDGRFTHDTEQTAFQLRYAPFSRALLENRNYISMISIMHRRSLFERCGGFRESAKRLVDWELVLRYTEDKPALSIPVVLSHYHRGHVANHVSKTEDKQGAMFAVDEALHKSRLPASMVDGMPDPTFALFGAHGSLAPENSRKRVSIVIPSYEVAEYLDLCVRSIREWTNNYELIIVDNASGSAVQDRLDRLEAEAGVTVIRNHKNWGFTYAVNQGIEAAEPGNDIVLLNNDALVTPMWLDALRDVVDDVPEAGIIAPRQVLPPGTKTNKIHVPGCIASREVDTNLSWHHANVLDPFFSPEKGYIELSYAPFFCVYIPRRVIDAAGLLDAENGPHYRSDQLYCDVVRHFLGKRIVYTPWSKVYHFHQQATVALRERDAGLFKVMYEQNRWKGIAGGGVRDVSAAGNGAHETIAAESHDYELLLRRMRKLREDPRQFFLDSRFSLGRKIGQLYGD
jgi:glycosyltransferase involved in cell wall biosynthesis